MKKLLMILILCFGTALIVNCGSGGGGGSSTSKLASGSTRVTINLGQTKTASSAGRLVKTAASIPQAIYSIKFTITAPDMAPIIRIIVLDGRTTISEVFDIPNGPNRLFVAEAMDSSGNVLYRGETYANLGGSLVTLDIVMVSVETLGPSFLGLESIGTILPTSFVLSWRPATDNITPSERIQYLIYISTTPGGQNFGNPSFSTEPGATSFTVTGLNPNTIYYVVVRARDERGNSDGNTIELIGQTPKPPDTTPPVFGGIISATALSTREILISWDAAADDETPAAEIVYLIYMSTTSHGQNLSIPSFTVTGVRGLTITGLTPDTTYYFIVRTQDAKGNIDTNIVEKSATTQPLPTPTPVSMPDLYPASISYGPMPLPTGQPTLSGFSITNGGTVDVTSFYWVVMYKDYMNTTYCWTLSSAGPVPAGGSVPALMSPVVTNHYYIMVDPVAPLCTFITNIPESNESNNSACSGDFCVTPPTPDEIATRCCG